MKRLGIVMLLATLVIGCGGDDDGTGPGASITGTWTLQSINGTSLPFVLGQTGQNKTEVTGDVLTVVEGGSFTEIATFRTTINGQVTTQTIADSGSYTLNGTAVTFRFNSDGSVNTGSWSGDTFTVAVDGFSYIYRRQ